MKIPEHEKNVLVSRLELLATPHSAARFLTHAVAEIVTAVGADYYGVECACNKRGPEPDPSIGTHDADSKPTFEVRCRIAGPGLATVHLYLGRSPNREPFSSEEQTLCRFLCACIHRETAAALVEACEIDGQEPLPDIDANVAASFELTEREREIVAGVARGRTNRQIARRLGVREATVKHHLYNVFNKTGVDNRSQLFLLVNSMQSQENPGA